MTTTKAFLIDLLERAGKSFLGGFLTVFTFAAVSGALNALSTGDWSVLEKLAVSASLAGGYAVASVVLSVLSGLKTGTASASVVVANSTPAAPATSPAAGGIPPVVPPALP